MQTIIFYTIYPFIWLFSKLPFSVLYTISDIFFFILYRIFGYRKKVVYDNLKICFPDKSEKEILKLRKEFFKHFIDNLIEGVKNITISEKEILKRYKYENLELLDQFKAKNQSVVFTTSHYANWEWYNSISKQYKGTFYASYKKIKNKHFEELIKFTRTKFGVKVIESSKFIKNILQNHKKEQSVFYLFISDQSPQLRKAKFWYNFFGNNIPWFNGPELIANKFNFPVIHINTRKIKRGYYTNELVVLTDNPKSLEKGEIMKRFVEKTEELIIENPQYYLWSHKRFKHLGKHPKN